MASHHACNHSTKAAIVHKPAASPCSSSLALSNFGPRTQTGPVRILTTEATSAAMIFTELTGRYIIYGELSDSPQPHTVSRPTRIDFRIDTEKIHSLQTPMAVGLSKKKSITYLPNPLIYILLYIFTYILSYLAEES